VKLIISYDLTNLSQAVEIAKKTAQAADIIEVGLPLLLSEGVAAVSAFRKEFPTKPILADAKLVDRVSDIIPLLCKSGASLITVLYGTSNKVIQKATTIAHEKGAKVILDLIDPETMGQAAREAEALNVDYVLFHFPHDETSTANHLDQWDSVRGNTKLPIFVSGRVSEETFADIAKLKPSGIFVSESITKAPDPTSVANRFKALTEGN
jgi:3-keto-L-gulonate-6-phosphate decarboxylase